MPMQEDRKFILDQLENIHEIASYMKDVPRLKQDNQNLSLTKYCKVETRQTGLRTILNLESKPPKLDWEKFPQSILKLLSIKSFFKRFTNE